MTTPVPTDWSTQREPTTIQKLEERIEALERLVSGVDQASKFDKRSYCGVCYLWFSASTWTELSRALIEHIKESHEAKE